MVPATTGGRSTESLDALRLDTVTPTARRQILDSLCIVRRALRFPANLVEIQPHVQRPAARGLRLRARTRM